MAWAVYRRSRNGSILWKDTDSGRVVGIIKVTGGWEVEDGVPSIQNIIFRDKQKALNYVKKLMRSNNDRKSMMDRNHALGFMFSFEGEENPRSDMAE